MYVDSSLMALQQDTDRLPNGRYRGTYALLSFKRMLNDAEIFYCVTCLVLFFPFVGLSIHRFPVNVFLMFDHLFTR